jgi:hypothetical protein
MHLTGNNDMATNAIDSYLNSLDKKSRKNIQGAEISEMTFKHFEALQEILNSN